jgi:hypothetical protein
MSSAFAENLFRNALRWSATKPWAQEWSKRDFLEGLSLKIADRDKRQEALSYLDGLSNEEIDQLADQ